MPLALGLGLPPRHRPTIGTELWSSDGATVGSGWTKDGDAFTHAGGGGTATVNKSIGLQTGARYRVTFRITGATAGQLAAVLGGDSNGTARTANGTYTEDVQSGADAILSLLPTSDFDGTVDQISVRQVTGG